MGAQIQALRRGADIVVATPGRLIDHLERRTVDLSGVEILTLDEADRMLDMGFLPALRTILASVPPARQTLLAGEIPLAEVEQALRRGDHFGRRVVATVRSRGQRVALQS